MILLDVATNLKKDYGYEEIPTNDLVNVLRDGFTAIGALIVKEGEGSVFQVPRFGSFKLAKRKARIGRNPQSGEKINIPEKIVVKFKPSSLFKEELLKVKGKKKEKTKGKEKAKGKAKGKAKAKK